MVRDLSNRDSMDGDDDDNNSNNDDEQTQVLSSPATLARDITPACGPNLKTSVKQESIDNSSKTDSINGFQSEYGSYTSNGAGSDHSENEALHNERNSYQSNIRQQPASHLQSGQQAYDIEPEQMRKLFIGGLDYKTSEDTLKVHFEKFGDVLDCVVMREPQSKRSRGFGFVIYASSSMVDRAQDARPHEVDGREVQSKRAISREDSGKPEAQATVKKVYLGGLSDDIEETELRDYFKDFGNIVNINIVAHKDTGKRRGFAFVEFDDYDPVDKIVLKKFHSIKDKRIEAKKAIPKVEMDARKRGDPRVAIAGAMMALSGPPIDCPNGRSRSSRTSSAGACLWPDAPYGTGGYPGNYSSQANFNGYPPHYATSSAHYDVGNWVLHGNQSGNPYGLRGAHGGPYGRNTYASHSTGWTSTATGYNPFPASQNNTTGGGGGPMRLSYQHRSWAPYGGYGAHRGRGYNS